jgi:hypothetical protein
MPVTRHRRTVPNVQFSRTGFLGRTRFRAKLKHQTNTRRRLTSVMRGRTTFMRSKNLAEGPQLNVPHKARGLLNERLKGAIKP